jgi:hypothetical protein
VGVLVKLKASARDCIFHRSPIWNSRNSLKSMIAAARVGVARDCGGRVRARQVQPTCAGFTDAAALRVVQILVFGQTAGRGERRA